ncbi:Uncharacterised protein [BD1-7 clade bacterium]|uniref:Transposase IS4-like domain-containing protein n=1 Tax=BD1-7 clade bacterium TaxID=2029982 RepID=A0A5S9QWK3_9GAMM|nr:Uncharacterised protein [BD1-7 clade bacterium]
MQLFLSPRFNIQTLRNTPLSSAGKHKAALDKLQSHQLMTMQQILAAYIPQSLFKKWMTSTASRRRIFTIENTFWGVFLQTLKPDSSCQSIVHQFRVNAKVRHDKTISKSTSAYCQARKRLPAELLSEVLNHTTQRCDDYHPLVNCRVVCADGTGLLAADTKKNQAQWPQQASQKVGCGFPQIRLCGLFNLHAGVALSYRLGNKRSHEFPLLREQEQTFKRDDIFVGDKGFICFYDQARLLAEGVDSIVALAKRKPVKAADAKRLIGPDDLLITIPKSTSKAAINRYPEERWNSLPESIDMRQIKVDITIPGYRTQSVYLLTTLLDETAFLAELIAELYHQRWRIELYFGDIKTTLGMEKLNSKSLDRVMKEIQMFFIVYNVLRLLMLDGSSRIEPVTMAFESCLQTLLAYHDREGFLSRKTALQYAAELRQEIVLCTLLYSTLLVRPGRAEPRQVKRRPKPFKLVTKPRSELRAEMLA